MFLFYDIKEGVDIGPRGASQGLLMNLEKESGAVLSLLLCLLNCFPIFLCIASFNAVFLSDFLQKILYRTTL